VEEKAAWVFFIVAGDVGKGRKTSGGADEVR